MQFQTGKVRTTVGHVSLGWNRHLINNLSSRGVSLLVPLSRQSDFSVAAVNGTNVVGWGNFIGLNNRKHQILSGTVGFDFLRERPGGIRLEATALYGSLLPITNFNQGNITDSEQSKGAGIRLKFSDPTQRFRLDGGFARSRFTNPFDSSLSGGFGIVPVRDTTRDARYLDASYDLLRGLRIGQTKQANLTLTYRHETVDPLFRSVAAYTQADRFQNQFEAVGSIADVTATFAYNRFNDNLDNIPSILKTLSRRSGFILGAPLVSLFGDPAKPQWWLPRVSYTFDRMHQFGDSLPINSGFTSASQVPDQLSDNQAFSSDWQAAKWRFGYRLNRSFQDNRQPGRELADLGNWMNGFTFGWTPVTQLDMSFDLNLESADNREQRRVDRTNRIGTSINWRMNPRSTLSVMVSSLFAADVAHTKKNRNVEVDTQWSYRLGVDRGSLKKMQSQFFVRYANRYARAFDNTFGFGTLTKLQTLNTGISFTFF
jgi:hypothetical protein